MPSSDSDSDLDWNTQLFFAVSKKQGNGPEFSEQHRCEQMKECLFQGANVNSVDKKGNTVLHIAVKKGYREVVRFLRRNGAATDIRNKLDCTAETLADNLGKLEISSILRCPIEECSKKVLHRLIDPTKFKSVDNEKPSTSRETILIRRDSSPGLVTQGLKRQLNTDTEYDGIAKKRRLVLADTSRRNDTDDTGSGGITFRGDLQPSENTERRIQTTHFDPRETYAASGLKQTLHGIVYQWKHLMLVLNRAWKMDYSFRLSTEMDAAEKFDDLVLEYVNSEGNKMHRFVQLKHKKDSTKTIGVRDLLDLKDGDFSVLKYFISWRKIKTCSDFRGSESKTFTLCTNIGLDVKGLKEADIDVNVIREPDDFLKVTNRIEQPPRYKVVVGKRSELYDILKFASDVHRLARELAERITGSKDIHLSTDIIRRYHAALAQEVVDIRNSKLFQNFIRNNDLSAKAKNFRDSFFLHTKKLFDRNKTEKEIWNELEGNKLKLSITFGTKFELAGNPHLTHIDQFSKEFVELLNNAPDDNVVKIDRRIYNKRASDLSKRAIADNIDKLAGHVLIMEGERIKFRSQFLNTTTQFSGNIDEFRDVLKTQLGSRFDKLDGFEFEIKNFKTCTEEALLSRTELPDDDIDDGEILAFLNGFILAVNQPDEMELGQMITEEIGNSQFNVPHAKLITDSFQIEILDWFKKTGKQSVFLANENAKDIFNELEGRLSSLVTLDLRLEYPKKLERWDISFERENTELRSFLENPHFTPNQILIISSRQTLLTALRIYQTLTLLEKIEGDDKGCIFIRLKKVSDTKIMDQVLRTFKWRGHHNLLVVNCESIGIKQYTQNLWNPLCEILKQNYDKEMILIITEGNNDCTVKFGIGYEFLHEKDDDIGIDNLKKCSQQKLLERKVVQFQGLEESFGRVLGIRNFDYIGAEKSKCLRRILDPNTLVQLVKTLNIRIGCEVEGLGTIQNYYIPRTMIRHVVIKEDIFKATGITDLFAIGDVDAEAFQKLLAKEARLRSFDDSSQIGPHLIEFIILDNGQEADQFKDLCELNSNRNIHWLRHTAGKFIWMQSFGDITNLLAHEDMSRSDDYEDRLGATSLTEDQLVNHDEQRRIIILSAVAGMGKSTVLTSLAGKIKDNDSSLLVIRINLTQHTTVLAEEKANRTFNNNNTNGAVNFLVDKLSGLDTDLESQVYKTIIKYDDKAVLLFDAFDEISPTYEDIMISLFQALVQLPIKKLFITTRPHTRGALEEKLGTFSDRLQPFSKDNQVEFLKRFWRPGSITNDSNGTLENSLEMHAEGVLNLMSKSIKHQITEFTGAPLQSMMIAEVYQYRGASKWKPFYGADEITVPEDGDPNLPKMIDIIDMYAQFIDKKYHIYCTEKKRGDPTNVAEINVRRKAHQIFLMTHKKLALDALFDNNTVEVLLNSQPKLVTLYEFHHDENEGEEGTGIISQAIGRKPEFIHRTFAEYFAATFLIDTLKDDSRNQQVRNFFVTELFVEPQYRTIRAFVNCLLSSRAYAVENKSWRIDLRKNQNAHLKTAYHVAAQECNVEIVKFLLNRLDESSNDESKEQEAGINLEDFNGNTPLAIVINNAYNLNVVKCFIEGGANIDWKSHDDQTLLHFAVQNPDNLDLVQYLCEKDTNINCQTVDGWTLLHSAANTANNIDVVRYLCDKGANVNCQRRGWTPLHLAAYKATNIDVVKYLCDKGADINCKEEDGRTPLHLAALIEHNLQVVKYLCEKGADINCQMEDGKQPLHLAARIINNLDVVKYLCDKGADVNSRMADGNTPLHLAIHVDNSLDLVKYLCNNGANVNCQMEDGKTPLHLAAGMGNALCVVKYLCNEGANVNCQTEDGKTPLHSAADIANNLDVVKYLCGKGADINCQTRNGETPLHLAARIDNHLDVVKYLCDKGADTNCQTKDCKTPLHLAARIDNNLDVVMYLCDNGANINCEEQDGKTPLHLAARIDNNLNVVMFLCDKGANIDCQTEDGKTPLHLAAREYGNLEVVKYLCDKGANIDCQMKDGKTPLHYAAREYNNIEVVKYLCDKGANINCQMKNGKTPLHLAADGEDNLEVVKYLSQKGANIKAMQ